MTDLKAVSLWQPWASLWMDGVKVHETRHWYLSHRGPLAIHAAKKKPSSLDLDPDFTRQVRSDLRCAALDDLPRGGIIGVLDVEGCQLTQKVTKPTDLDLLYGDWSGDRYAICATNRQPLRGLFPLRGQQGLWSLTEDEARAVMDMVR